jgi:hypothetical protein
MNVPDRFHHRVGRRALACRNEIEINLTIGANHEF